MQLHMMGAPCARGVRDLRLEIAENGRIAHLIGFAKIRDFVTHGSPWNPHRLRRSLRVRVWCNPEKSISRAYANLFCGIVSA